jgi:hypothetical protein
MYNILFINIDNKEEKIGQINVNDDDRLIFDLFRERDDKLYYPFYKKIDSNTITVTNLHVINIILNQSNQSIQKLTFDDRSTFTSVIDNILYMQMENKGEILDYDSHFGDYLSPSLCFTQFITDIVLDKDHEIIRHEYTKYEHYINYYAYKKFKITILIEINKELYITPPQIYEIFNIKTNTFVKYDIYLNNIYIYDAQNKPIKVTKEDIIFIPFIGRIGDRLGNNLFGFFRTIIYIYQNIIDYPHKYIFIYNKKYNYDDDEEFNGIMKKMVTRLF